MISKAQILKDLRQLLKKDVAHIPDYFKDVLNFQDVLDDDLVTKYTDICVYIIENDSNFISELDNAIFNYIKQKEYYYKSILEFTNLHKLNLYNLLNINYYLKKDQVQNEQLSTQLFAFTDLLHKLQNEVK